MQHTRKIRIIRAPATPPRIEFDPAVMGWYVRFKSAKVAKTISEDASGYVYAIDLDSQGELIGFELLGVREFSIEMLLSIPLVDFSRTDFGRAKFVPAVREDLVEA